MIACGGGYYLYCVVLPGSPNMLAQKVLQFGEKINKLNDGGLLIAKII